MKRERYWLFLAGIVVLVAAAIWVDLKKQVHYGLDIRGGIRAVLQAEPGPHDSYDQAALLRILETRLNSTGVSEPVIQPKGDKQFIVELPNVRNKDAIINQLGTTAQMEFRWFGNVHSDRNPYARYAYTTNHDAQGREQTSFTDNQTHREFRDQSQILADFQDKILSQSAQRATASLAAIPAPLSQFAGPQPLYLTPDQGKTVAALNQELSDYQSLIAQSPLQLTGKDILSNSTASLNPTQGGAQVNINFTPHGTDVFGQFTRDHTKDLLAIILDGRVLSIPRITEPIEDGQCQISGGFANLSEAQTLANFLNAGALPVPLSIVQVESVEATLGPSAIHDSLIAGAIGLGAVLIFMIGYYLLPGFVAAIALIFYALFTLAVFKGGLSWFIPPVTLTLPGIAGFILSVGMAVDANILIFERMKEELRNGKPLRQAIDAGFSRAFPAIRDSNICTLITCTILYSMGTASVRGFALTLGLGVLISLFTAITVTRTLLYLLVETGAGKNPALFGLGRQWEPRFNAVKNRKVFYAISLGVIVPGLIALAMGGLKKSIEFTGGTQVALVFQQPVAREAVQNALKSGAYSDNLVQMADGGKIAYISVKQTATDTYTRVADAVKGIGTPFTMQSHSLVGGVISKELTSNAIQAVFIASLLIVLYLATVFAIGGFVAGLRFGVSAIVALLHDVLVLLGVFAILGFLLNWQIDSLFVTAILTVVGFSVHDTIVIFDRLRENLRHRYRGESFEDLANRSIQQSFARSINTSFTVVLTLVALLIFGEPSTKILNWALLIGIISGTYSSIFNATPILVDWEMSLGRRRTGASMTDRVEATESRPGNGAARPAPVATAKPLSSSSIAARESGGTTATGAGVSVIGSDGKIDRSRIKKRGGGPSRRF